MELIKFDEMSRQVEAAKDIDEIKQLTDKLEAIRVLAKQSKQSLETQNRIAKYRLKVERKKGEWLKNNINYGGDRKSESRSTDATLKKIGITKNESSDAQRIANIPDDKFKTLIKEIEEEGKELTKSLMVNTAKKIERELEIQETKENISSGKIKLPEGKYQVIVIDPPWDYGNHNDYDPITRRSTTPYPELSTDKLKKLQIPADENCIMFLWTTHQFIWDAKELLEKWGFKYKAILTWNKEKMGMGAWFRMQCEFCLLGIKGKPIWDATDVRDIISEPRREHSRKPEAFYTLVNKITVGNKLDYFSREKRDGWATFGAEDGKYE